MARRKLLWLTSALVLLLVLLSPSLRGLSWNPFSSESIRERVLGEECRVISHESEIVSSFDYKLISTRKELAICCTPDPTAPCSGRAVWQAKRGPLLFHAVLEEEMVFDENCELVSLKRMRETGSPQSLRELEEFAGTRRLETSHGCVWLPELLEGKQRMAESTGSKDRHRPVVSGNLYCGISIRELKALPVDSHCIIPIVFDNIETIASSITQNTARYIWGFGLQFRDRGLNFI